MNWRLGHDIVATWAELGQTLSLPSGRDLLHFSNKGFSRVCCRALCRPHYSQGGKNPGDALKLHHDGRCMLLSVSRQGTLRFHNHREDCDSAASHPRSGHAWRAEWVTCVFSRGTCASSHQSWYTGLRHTFKFTVSTLMLIRTDKSERVRLFLGIRSNHALVGQSEN